MSFVVIRATIISPRILYRNWLWLQSIFLLPWNVLSTLTLFYYFASCNANGIKIVQPGEYREDISRAWRWRIMFSLLTQVSPEAMMFKNGQITYCWVFSRLNQIFLMKTLKKKKVDNTRVVQLLQHVTEHPALWPPLPREQSATIIWVTVFKGYCVTTLTSKPSCDGWFWIP